MEKERICHCSEHVLAERSETGTHKLWSGDTAAVEARSRAPVWVQGAKPRRIFDNLCLSDENIGNRFMFQKFQDIINYFTMMCITYIDDVVMLIVQL